MKTRNELWFPVESKTCESTCSWRWTPNCSLPLRCLSSPSRHAAGINVRWTPPPRQHAFTVSICSPTHLLWSFWTYLSVERFLFLLSQRYMLLTVDLSVWSEEIAHKHSCLCWMVSNMSLVRDQGQDASVNRLCCWQKPSFKQLPYQIHLQSSNKNLQKSPFSGYLCWNEWSTFVPAASCQEMCAHTHTHIKCGTYYWKISKALNICRRALSHVPSPDLVLEIKRSHKFHFQKLLKMGLLLPFDSDLLHVMFKSDNDRSISWCYSRKCLKSYQSQRTCSVIYTHYRTERMQQLILGSI